jgi:hypothetical protein
MWIPERAVLFCSGVGPGTAWLAVSLSALVERHGHVAASDVEGLRSVLTIPLNSAPFERRRLSISYFVQVALVTAASARSRGSS